MIKKSILFIIPVVVVTVIAVGATLLFVNKNENASLVVVGEKAIAFVNESLAVRGLTASLVDIIEDNTVYKLTLEIDGEEYTSYASKDGKLLFPEGYLLDEEENEGDNPSDNAKSDKPDVKVFVMSYCPYGLQAQKMFIPVYDLLKDKADMGVYFVDYIMHDKIEIEENIRQYCIQKEEKEKYSAYLKCFTVNGDYEECFTEAGIDATKNASCYSQTDSEFNITAGYDDKSTWLNGYYPQFNIHKDLNDQYEVSGSPTVIINGQIAPLSSRTPEGFKNAICNAFNNAPEECNQTLSNEAPVPSFGEGTGSTSGGSCQ